jgi:predicted kinase
MKLKCIHLVGVPGAGKSTWIKTQTMLDNFVVVSTDNFVEQYAKEQGKTYNEVFDDYMKIAVRLMANQALIAQANNKNIIWDQTSTSVGARAKKFNMLPNYEHIAVVFPTPEKDELARRLASRPGKNIPDHVMRSMIDGFVMPTLDEGYTEIVVL